MNKLSIFCSWKVQNQKSEITIIHISFEDFITKLQKNDLNIIKDIFYE